MFRALAAVLTVVSMAALASAGLIGYEPVDGPAGPLDALDNNIQLGEWDVQNGDPLFRIAQPGLSFGALQVAGGKAVGGGDWTSCGMSMGISPTWAPDDNWTPFRKEVGQSEFFAGAEGTTVWASYLVEPLSASASCSFRLHAASIPWNGGGNYVQIGVENNQWAIRHSGNPSVATGVARTVGQTYLMVAKIEFIDETADRVTLFINPTPGAATPDVAGTVLNTSGDFYFRGLYWYPSSDPNTGAVDEIRFGTSFADVTPVPEPASLALLALGGLLIRRRR